MIFFLPYKDAKYDQAARQCLYRGGSLGQLSFNDLAYARTEIPSSAVLVEEYPFRWPVAPEPDLREARATASALRREYLRVSGLLLTCAAYAFLYWTRPDLKRIAGQWRSISKLCPIPNVRLAYLSMVLSPLAVFGYASYVVIPWRAPERMALLDAVAGGVLTYQTIILAPIALAVTVYAFMFCLARIPSVLAVGSGLVLALVLTWISILPLPSFSVMPSLPHFVAATYTARFVLLSMAFLLLVKDSKPSWKPYVKRMRYVDAGVVTWAVLATVLIAFSTVYQGTTNGRDLLLGMFAILLGLLIGATAIGGLATQAWQVLLRDIALFQLLLVICVVLVMGTPTIWLHIAIYVFILMNLEYQFLARRARED